MINFGDIAAGQRTAPVRGLNRPAEPFVCLRERPASLLDTATDPMLRTLSLFERERQ